MWLVDSELGLLVKEAFELGREGLGVNTGEGLGRKTESSPVIIEELKLSIGGLF